MNVPLLLALALLAVPASAAKLATPPLLTLNVADNGNPYMKVAVKQATLNIRIALSYDQGMVLNPAAVQRAALKPFPLIGKFSFSNSAFGNGKSVLRFNLATITPQALPARKVPVVWLETPMAGDAEGILPIGALAADRIDVILRDTPPGSQSFIIPKKGKEEAMIKTRIGDEPVTISLELNIPTTVMNARAGEALVKAGLVRRTSSLGFWRPVPGVALPTQTLSPKTGLTIAGLPMRQMGVRISETEARAIDAAARGTSTDTDDEDTITVSADRNKKRRGRDPWILIGRDVLDDCSRISFDRAGERWVLTCKFG
ncbi:hypothetical protein [Sandarakinorhabdus sp.]|jgi:hypothetical protein|uniref:hypothetical protein n=1 Tax=Sandarakinorhabdus sp. TaxID=1916663 RepID=UPI00334174CA